MRQREELPLTQRNNSSEILTCPYGKLYKDSDQCQQPIPKDKKRGAFRPLSFCISL